MKKALFFACCILLIVVLFNGFSFAENLRNDQSLNQSIAPPDPGDHKAVNEPDQNSPKNIEIARSGCCSHHNGVCGCDEASGMIRCCDGSLSPSCTCSDY